MRMNNREKNLLLIMIAVLLGWVLYDFVIEEQIAVMADQTIELNLKQEEVDNLKTLIAREEEIDSQIASDYRQIQSVAEKYFNTTKQEERVLLLTDFLLMPYIEESTLSFMPPEPVDIEGVTFVKDSVVVNVAGQYGSLVDMLKIVWSFPKKIDVSSLSVNAAGFDEVNAEFIMDFYTFSAESGLVDDLYKWYIDELFIKENPFSAVERNDTIVRYLYVPDENLFNYTKYLNFTDIEGHWNQYEIETFLDLGYLYLNPYLEFGPDEPITRGEFIVLLDAYYNWPTIYDSEFDLTDFRDYEDLGSLENSFAKAIHKGYLSGIVEGYTDQTLRPRDPISYEEVEILMNKVKDTTTFDWTVVANSIAANKGVSNEDWSSDYGSLTRAEAVYLLYYFN